MSILSLSDHQDCQVAIESHKATSGDCRPQPAHFAAGERPEGHYGEQETQGSHQNRKNIKWMEITISYLDSPDIINYSWLPPGNGNLHSFFIFLLWLLPSEISVNGARTVRTQPDSARTWNLIITLLNNCPASSLEDTGEWEVREIDRWIGLGHKKKKWKINSQ